MKTILTLIFVLEVLALHAQLPSCPMDNFGGNVQININTILPTIHTNITTGEAPLYVYVSAFQTTSPDTQNPYYDIEYSWDFGDTSTTNTTTFIHPVDGSVMSVNQDQQGPEAAYLYKSPGSYNVTLRARAWNGTDYITTVTSTTIVVSAWSGTDRYFDPANGDDANTGTSPASPLKTWGALSTWLNGANNRAAYIKSGETMIVTSTLATKKSNLRIGAYGSGANPILLASASMTNSTFINANGTNANISNHYYSDIDFDVNSNAGSVFFGYSDATGSLSNVIFDNCNFKNGNTESLVITTGSGAKQSFLLWNCNFYMNQGARQNFVPYNTPYCAVVGGQQTGGNGNAVLDHHMYINQCNHSLIRWVDFGTSVNRNFCLNMNSPSFNSDTYYTLIDGCNITGTNNGIDFSNSNNDNTGHFTKTIVQNSAIHDLNNGSQGFGIFGYSIKDICIRYNRFYNNSVADINIFDTDNVYLVYKNWFYTSAAFPNTSVVVANNQQGSFTENIFVTEANANSLHFSGDLSNIADWTIDLNQYWHPNLSVPFYEAGSASSLNFNQWQNLGYDTNGKILNPLFPDPANGDFGQLPMAKFSFVVNNQSVNYTNQTINNPPGWEIFYAWDFGDGNTSADIDPVNVYQNQGTYLVKLATENNCGINIDSQNVSISILGILDGDNQARIKVYPNPLISAVMIDFSKEIIEGELIISNISGKLLYSEKIVKCKQASLSLNRYSSGIYILSVKNKQTKSMSTFKLVKK